MSGATFVIMSSLFGLACMIFGAAWDVGPLLALGIWLNFLSIAGLILWSGDHTLKALLKEAVEDND